MGPRLFPAQEISDRSLGVRRGLQSTTECANFSYGHMEESEKLRRLYVNGRVNICARAVAHGYEAIMRYMSMAATGSIGSVVFRRVSLEQ